MPNPKAKFFYRSFIDQDVTGYILSGDFAPTAYITDRRKNTCAIFAGSNGEFIADMLTERNIDTIFLKCNFKRFTIYYWDGSAYIELVDYTANTEEYLTINFSEKTTSAIKVICWETIPPSPASAKIYFCEITRYINELYLEGTDIKQKQERADFENVYGGSIQIVKYPNRGKIAVDLSWANMTADDYAIYVALKALFLLDALNLYLYFSDDFDLVSYESIYLVNDMTEKEASPASETWTAGVNGEMKLREC